VRRGEVDALARPGEQLVENAAEAGRKVPPTPGRHEAGRLGREVVGAVPGVDHEALLAERVQQVVGGRCALAERLGDVIGAHAVLGAREHREQVQHGARGADPAAPGHAGADCSMLLGDVGPHLRNHPDRVPG
jgi:hypothetical protein